jgi:glycosidase
MKNLLGLRHQKPHLIGDITLQYYPLAAGPIDEFIDYVAGMGFGRMLSSPNLKYKKKVGNKIIVPRDGIYAPLVDDIYGVPEVAEEFGGDAGIIASNAMRLEKGIISIFDLVPNHCGEQSETWQRALRGDREMQALFRLFNDPVEAQYTNHVNIFGEANYRLVEEIGMNISQTFRPDQIEFDAANQLVREYFKRLIRHAYEKLGYRGFRLDAIVYLATRVLTTLTGTGEQVAREFAQDLRSVIDELPGAFTIAEAGGERDEIAMWVRDHTCQGTYDFGIAPRILYAVHAGIWTWLREYLQNSPQIDQDSWWFNFLRSHDEVQLRYVLELIREAMIEAFGGSPDEGFKIFNNMGLNPRLSQLVPNDAALVMTQALILCLDGKPMLYLGDAEGSQGDIYGHLEETRPDERIGNRNPFAYVPNPPLFGWPSMPERPFTPDSLEKAAMAQWGNPLSTQQQIRRIMHLRNTHPVMQNGLRWDCTSSNQAIYPFVRLKSERGDLGKKGDIICLFNASGNRENAYVGLKPWRGHYVKELLTNGRHYLGDYRNGGFQNLRWEKPRKIERDEPRFSVPGHCFKVLEVID